ncbi:MAG: TIGR02285 family protein [Pseudomonadota bacterium]
MTHRSKWRSIWASLITSALFVWTPGSLAAEKLIWLLRDLPPLTVFDGPLKGQGMIDQLMPVLMTSMPHYQHVILRVNRARAIQMLESPSLTCDPSLVWNPTRASRIAYSTPLIGLHSNGMVIRRKDQSLIAPFVHDEKVDLPALLGAQALKLGVIAKRSYGEWIDDQLSQSPASQIVIHYGNDPLDSLLQMQQADRLQALLGYWPEIQAKAGQQGLSPDSLIFYRIQGAPTYQPIHIGCSDTPEGREAIRSINAILANLGRDARFKADTQWLSLDPVQEASPP